jgi:hypothetical protein
MKKALPKILTGILVSLLVCFLASCQDLTGPQGEPGADGRDAALSPDIGAALSSALAAKTGGDGEPWAVKISGLDLSDSYTARQLFHGVAAAIPEGGIDLDLSDCTGAFFGYDPGVSLKDKARYTGLTLPDSLTHINDGKRGNNPTYFGAFADFTNLTRISAAGLLRVGDSAFLGCAALETLDLPNVTGIGAYAFAANTDLSSSSSTQFAFNTVLARVDLPKVETIGDYAFLRCLAIAELDLPEVLSIGRYAFASVSTTPNTVLETVDLPQVETIENSAFRYCPAVKTINLPNAGEILGYAFGADSAYPNTVLESVVLPEAGIVHTLFEYCTALKSADLPVAGSIGSGMFRGCAALTTVNAPEAASVGDNAFEGCTSLVTLDLPKVRSFGVSAFKSCAALTTLNAPEVTDMGNTVFEGCTGLVTLDLSKVRSFGVSAFKSCAALTSLNAPEVTNVGNTAFESCTGLVSLELLKVTSLGRAPFTACTGLTTLKLGPSVPSRTTTSATYGILRNTGSASEALTIQVPAASRQAYTDAGWVDTAANSSTTGSALIWGGNHKQVLIVDY